MVSGVEKGGDGVTGTEIQNLSRVKYNKAYGGKYRNTGLVIQFMFIYRASVTIKIVPWHLTENKSQASNILASDVIRKCGDPLRVLITHINWLLCNSLEIFEAERRF